MRFRALIVAAVLCATGAFAGWFSTGINAGTPYDVTIIDAGVFIVTGATNAQLVSCTQAQSCSMADQLTQMGLAGTQLNGGCMWGVIKTTGLVVGNSGCNYGGNLNVSTQAFRLRCAPGGFCAASALRLGAISELYVVASPGPAPWTPISLTGAGSNPFGLSVVEAGNVVYSLPFSVTRLFLAVDGGAAQQLPTPVNPSPTDVKLLVRRNGSLGAIFTEPGAPTEFFGADLTAGTPPDAGWVSLTVDPSVGGLAHVAYTEQGGSSLGFGFGVASQTDAGQQLAGPVPNPARPGLDWIARTATTPGPGVTGVYCYDPTFCVLTTPTAVFAYWNSAKPAGSISTPAAVTEGSTSIVTANVTDSDGDPVFVTWELDGGGLYTVVPDGGDLLGATAFITFGPNPSASCTSQVTLYAYASDGLGANDSTLQTAVPVTYLRTTPDVPQILPQTIPAVVAGSSQMDQLIADAGGCGGTLTWTLLQDAGVLQAAGGSAAYTPPQNWCQAGGGVVVQLTASLDGGSRSTQATIPITPWGAPSVPVFAGAMPVMQLAGTDASYPLAAVGNHVCEDAGAFPGLVIASTAVGQMPGGVTTSGNGAVLEVTSADACVSGPFSIVVQTAVVNDATHTSPAGMFSGVLIANPPPLVGTYPFLMGLDPAASMTGIAQGTFSETVPCPALRSLSATVDIFGPDGGATAHGLFPIPPQGWVLPVGGGCGGGTYSARAQLFADAGPIGQESRTFFVQPQGTIFAPTFTTTTLDVTCEGLDAQVSVVPSATGCNLDNALVTWTETSSAALSIAKNSNESAQLTSIAPGLDALVGETVHVQLVADDGIGHTVTAGGDVLLTHTFVDVTHDMMPAASNADELTTVRVTVHNRESCRVQNVVLKETPQGLSYVTDSARADRDVVSATLLGSELDIGPFTLEPNQTRVISYLARAALLSTPLASGDAWIKAADVTTPSSVAQAPNSCGCDSSVPALALLLACFSLWPRRRALSPLRTSRRSASRTRPSRTGAPGSP